MADLRKNGDSLRKNADSLRKGLTGPGPGVIIEPQKEYEEFLDSVCMILLNYANVLKEKGEL